MIVTCKTKFSLLYMWLLLLLLGVCPMHVQAQVPFGQGVDSLKSETIEIHFYKGSSVIERSLSNNRAALTRLSALITELGADTLSTITSIEINSSASPEGSVSWNRQVSQERSESIAEFLQAMPLFPDVQIIKKSHGIAWDKLVKLVKEKYFPHRTEVLDIIENTPEETWEKKSPSDPKATLVDSRNSQLMRLRGGEPYRYMEKHFFPQLRSSTVVTIYNQPKLQERPIAIVTPPSVKKITPLDSIVVVQDVDTFAIVEPIKVDKTPRSLFALKTNLLFDAVSLLNVEIEVPIGQRWSIAGEWIFPWWTQDNGKADSKRNRLQLLNANLEGKYWFAGRENRPQMTGWFAGVYVGAGLYDLEYSGKGYQGDLFTMGGLSGGYAHTINKKGTLRMEYSLGVGYMQTDYKYYEVHSIPFDGEEWHPIKKETKRFIWIGPTKAKVSLVWMLNTKRNRK